MVTIVSAAENPSLDLQAVVLSILPAEQQLQVTCRASKPTLLRAAIPFIPVGEPS